MDTQFHDQTKEQVTPTPSPREDDFELDSMLDFKPINKGLGFHHQQVAAKTFTRPVVAVRDVERPRPNIVWDKEVSSPANLTRGLTEAMKSQQVMISPRELISADKRQRVGAFLIDVIILTFMVAGTLSLLFASAGLETGMVAKLAVRPEFLIYPLVLFVLFYIPYFTLLESSGATVGKSILGIMVETTDGSSPSAGQVLLRSLLTLFALVSAGVLFLVDCQGRMTDTRVVKRG
jgi:uncharacterized RDD family membrane protein YckC